MEEANIAAGMDWFKLKNQLSDITNQLEEMRIYTEAIIDIVNDPVIILDKDLMVKSVTKGFCDHFNVTEAEVENRYFNEIKKCPWNEPCLIEKLSELLVNKSSFSEYEIRCDFPGSVEKYFRINARHLEIFKEKYLIIISIHDITILRQEKKQLAENKQLLEDRITLAVEAAEMGTWEMDITTSKLSCDERCRELLGTDDELISFGEFIHAIHPEDRAITEETVTGVLKGMHGGKFNMELRTRFEKEDDMRWLKASGKVYFTSKGKAARFAGTVMDISQQKFNEQLLKESEERFRVTSDAAAVMIWLSGTDRVVNYFNKSWLKFTGKTFEEQKGDGWINGVYPEDLDRCIEIYVQNFKARKEFYMEYRLRRHDGVYRWISDSGVPRFSPAGIFEGFIGTCMDIHDQKMTKEELEKIVAERTQLLSDAVNNLESSNRNLEEFAYIASHDLQEPLRKIQTFASRLEHKNGALLSDETKLYLSKITKASVRMSSLIGDLLNYSRLQKTDHPVNNVDLNEIVGEVLNDFDLHIQEKKAAVHLTTLPVIKADPMRMHQLFHNLLSNALKFSKAEVPPVINISAATLTDRDKSKYPSLKKEAEYAVIFFGDNGIGFNEEFAEKIFNIFQRLNGNSEYEGTGIGLAICRKIVINHHGLIIAQSREDEGALFKIILPLY